MFSFPREKKNHRLRQGNKKGKQQENKTQMKGANQTNHDHASHFNRRAKNWWMKPDTENMILIYQVQK